MTWQRLWIRLFYRRPRPYLGYLATAAFSVTLFYLFQSLGLTMKGLVGIYGRDYLVGLLRLMKNLTFLFALGTVFYFHRLLLQSESPSLGLLATLGLSPKGRRALVWLESVMLGTGALITGLLAGIFLEPLLLLAASVILKMPQRLPYIFRAEPLVITCIFFTLLFAGEGFLTAWWAVKRWPKQLLAASRGVEEVTPASLPRALKGFTLLALAYVLAAVVHPWIFRQAQDSNLGILVVLWLALALVLLGLVLGGGYLTLAEGFRWWWRSTAGRRNAQGLLLRARLSARVKSHAAAGAVIAFLLAAVLTAGSLLVGMHFVLLQWTCFENPIPVQLTPMSPQEVAPLGKAAEEVERELQEGGFSPVERLNLEVIRAKAVLPSWEQTGEPERSQLEKGIEIIRARDYQRLIHLIERYLPTLRGLYPSLPELKPGEAFALRAESSLPEWLKKGGRISFIPVQDGEDYRKLTPESLKLSGRPRLEVEIAGSAAVPAQLADTSRAGFPFITFLVVDDRTFAGFLEQGKPHIWTYPVVALFYPRWQESHAVVSALKDVENSYPQVAVNTLADAYANRYQYAVGLLFTLALLTLLFTLASVTVVYFKLREGRERDLYQVAALRRLGAPQSLLKGLLGREALNLILLPWLLALAHSFFALWDWLPTARAMWLSAENVDLARLIWTTWASLAAGTALIYFVLGLILGRSYAGELLRTD
ncbi:FtsX-like permease family protein [Desulfothermobacter acidiphilus]|uniref:FtsX-like permease family protein n=1 Tax=Desulfothermobacter acidiphilus TaxID=1938353 RepID=UPI003F8C8517